MKRISDSRVQDQGFGDVLFESEFTEQGPISVAIEEMELAPGPPPR